MSKKIEEFTKIKGTRGDRPSLSFAQMYELREAIETLKGKNFNVESARGVKSAITQKGLDQMNDVIKELDKFMTPQSVEDLLRVVKVTASIKPSALKNKKYIDRADDFN